MRMMRIAEYCKQNGGTSRRRIITLIENGMLKSVWIGSAHLIDAEEADRLLSELGPRGSGGTRYGGILELQKRTGLSRRQVRMLIDNGIFKQVNKTGRAVFDLDHAEGCIRRMMRGAERVGAKK